MNLVKKVISNDLEINFLIFFMYLPQDTKDLDGTLNLIFLCWDLLSLEKYIAEIEEKSLSCGLLKNLNHQSDHVHFSATNGSEYEEQLSRYMFVQKWR